MDSLGALRAFVQAAETGGFTEAGRRLGISPSAVSKAVVRLEERFGTRLFHRSTRSISLTPEGVKFLDRCHRILCEFEMAESELSQTCQELSGRLRVSLPSLGALFLPAIAVFARHHPQIELELDFTDRLVDVIEEGFDAVIRTGHQGDSRLMARKLGSYRRAVVASPDYLRRHGVPEKSEDLARHSCLVYRFPTTGKLDRWRFRRQDEIFEADLTARMVLNSLEPQISLAEQGIGLVSIPDLSVRPQLANGTLVSVLEDYLDIPTPLQVMWPSSRHLSPKLRAFVDFLATDNSWRSGPIPDDLANGTGRMTGRE